MARKSFSQWMTLKAAQPVNHSGINVNMIKTKAHSLASAITQPDNHKSQAYSQCSLRMMSKRQFLSIITRIPSRKNMLQKIPTKTMRINISNGFKFCS